MWMLHTIQSSTSMNRVSLEHSLFMYCRCLLLWKALGNWDRASMAHKAENIYCLVLCRKSLLTLVQRHTEEITQLSKCPETGGKGASMWIEWSLDVESDTFFFLMVNPGKVHFNPDLNLTGIRERLWDLKKSSKNINLDFGTKDRALIGLW